MRGAPGLPAKGRMDYFAGIPIGPRLHNVEAIAAGSTGDAGRGDFLQLRIIGGRCQPRGGMQAHLGASERRARTLFHHGGHCAQFGRAGDREREQERKCYCQDVAHRSDWATLCQEAHKILA